MAALHHRRKKELADVAAALAADYAEARAEAAAAYRLMVGGWEGEGPYGTRGLTGRWQRCGTCQPCALHPFATCLTPPPPPPLCLVQEEELKNRASEALNVTKLSLEGRVRELEAAVEEQHRVGVEGGGRRAGGEPSERGQCQDVCLVQRTS